MNTKLNTGAIFKNDKKTAENHPDYKGHINVDGKEKQVSLWLKTSAAGTKFFSVAISEPYVKPGTAAATTVINQSDDLPF